MMDVYFLKFNGPNEVPERVRYLTVVRDGLYSLPTRDELDAICKVSSAFDYNSTNVFGDYTVWNQKSGHLDLVIHEGIVPEGVEDRIEKKPYVKGKTGKLKYCIRTFVHPSYRNANKEIPFNQFSGEILYVAKSMFG